MIEAMKQLREVHAIQGQKGCYDVDEYMLGLYNGLELALSIMEQRPTKYKNLKGVEKQESVAENYTTEEMVRVLEARTQRLETRTAT